MNKKHLVLIGLAVIISVRPQYGLAENYGIGAKAMGMGGAFTAVADDATAFYWNPAGITQLKGALSPGIGLEGDYGQVNDLLDNDQFPPDFDTLNLAALGYLGLSTRYIAVNGYFDISGKTVQEKLVVSSSGQALGFGYLLLTVAGKLKEDWAWGINIKKIYGKLNLYQVKSLAFWDSSENYLVTADGEGTALDIGLLYQLNPKSTLGFIGRNLSASMDWNGDYTGYSMGNPVIHLPYQSGLKPNAEYVVGWAYRPSTIDLLAVDLQFSPESQERFQTRIGLQKSFFGEKMTVRAGAFTNFGDANGVSAGLGWRLGISFLDLAVTKGGGDRSLGVHLNAQIRF